MKKLEILEESEEDMETYRKSILKYHDVRSAMDCAREEGLEKGLKRGREEEKNSIIQKSLQMNIPIEVIVGTYRIFKGTDY